MNRWGTDHSLIYLEASNKYIGFQNFIDGNRMEDAEEINIEFLNNKILPLINSRYNVPKYHIIRSQNKNIRECIELWCKKNKFNIKYIDSSTRKNKDDDIKTLLLLKPLCHTFIIIKGFWRAGKRMIDKHIGIAYEYNINQDFNVTAQGLIARFCGNDKQTNSISAPYFFCNTTTIKNYLNFIKNDCNFKRADYISNKLKIQEGEIKIVKSSLFHKMLNGSDDNIDLIKRKDYVDIPYEFNITDELYNIIENNAGKKRQEIILNLIKTNNSILHNIISSYNCYEITIPETDSSYKKKILALRNAIINNKHIIPPDKKKNDEYKNCWISFIDNRSLTKKIYIMVYHGMKRNNML